MIWMILAKSKLNLIGSTTNFTKEMMIPNIPPNSPRNIDSV